MNVVDWATLAAAILVLLGIDLWISRRVNERALRTGLIATLSWTVLGVLFAIVVDAELGRSGAGDYLTVFTLEKALSLDNVAVFAAILAGAAIPATQQASVLTGGLLGALGLRVVFILIGLALLSLAHLLLAFFGAALLATGGRMLWQHVRHRDDAEEGGGEPLRWAPGFLRRSPAVLALIGVLLADVAFAVDSILAAFAVTRHAYPIVAANAFAVLGLRPLYVVLVVALERFRHLPAGVAVLLIAIGVELVLEPFVAVPAWLTVTAVGVCLAASVLASIVAEQRDDRGRTEPAH